METPDSLVARNVAHLRDQRRYTVRELSEIMERLGAKILPSGITKIENRGRGVDVQDLVALAIALGVTPNRLLLPGRTDGPPVALTPTTVVEPSSAWRWADGDFILVTEDNGHKRFDQEQYSDFVRHSRPADRWTREQHTAVRAARDVLSRVDDLLRMREAIPDPTALPEGSARRVGAEEAPARVRQALARLIAEVDDLLGPVDAS